MLIFAAVSTSFTTFVTNIRTILSDAGLAMAGVCILIGAFSYMLSAGNTRGIERAKLAMLGAVLGFAVVVGVNTITTLVTSLVP